MEKATKKAYLECGKIAATHGVRGAVLIESWCDSPEVILHLPCVYLPSPSGEYRPMVLTKRSVYKGRVMATPEGLSTLDEVIPLKGKVLYAAREDIPVEEGQMLLADMIGLPVYHDETGELLGHLTDITDSVASPLYTVRTPAGEDILVPAVPAFVRSLSEDGVRLHTIEGLFDHAD